MTRRKGKTTENHDAAIQRVRELFAKQAQKFNASTFPDHEVLHVELNASTPSIVDDDEIDVTGLSFVFEISILPSAFTR